MPEIQKLNQHFNAEYIQQTLCFTQQLSAESLQRLYSLEGFEYQQDGHVGDYMSLSVMDYVSKRIVRVIGPAILGLLSGMVIHSYEDAIEVFTVLALYMPMIADSAGTQYATVMVRFLALGSVKLRDWLSVLWKETRIAIGGALAVITLGKVSLLSYGVELPANLTLTMLGCAIGLALFFQIVSSTEDIN
ncbi:magnesium transporter [Vibrio mediterranei]|uniref:magnesium transporter n=1 Tax=Vibrio mediterranei TaxID=689 RepID=UPI002283DCA8|nr:magnesium transporter [Vibrio mediterranei]MCY9856042.1 hypothetical protein [Vibrio mediterranei]